MHLDAGTVWAPAGSCELCHPPGGRSAATHDNRTVDLPFGGLSVNDAAAPVYDPVAGTCSNTYCHGSTLPEGGVAPTWTGGAAEAACGTCHGNPPNGEDSPIHASITGCNGVCHSPTSDDDGNIGDPSRHIDGTIDP